MSYTVRNLLIAAGLMMLGIMLVTSFISGERNEIARGQERITVQVAAKEIPSGTPVSELKSGGYLSTKDIPREAAPPQPVGDLKSIKGLVSNETVYEGEFLSVTAFDRRAGLKPTAQIKGNERLFTLPIPSANDIAGAIKPGDRIDLSASVETGTGLQRVVLGRDIEVMETPESLMPSGQELDETAPKANGDTKLYVLRGTDAEAQYILWGLSAADKYGVSMLLRASNGDTQTAAPPIKQIDRSIN